MFFVENQHRYMSTCLHAHTQTHTQAQLKQKFLLNPSYPYYLQCILAFFLFYSFCSITNKMMVKTH